MPDLFYREHKIEAHPSGAQRLLRHVPGTPSYDTLLTGLDHAEATRARKFLRRVASVFAADNGLTDSPEAAQKARRARAYRFRRYVVEKGTGKRWFVVECASRARGKVAWTRTEASAERLIDAAMEGLATFRRDNGYLLPGEHDLRTPADIDRMDWMAARSSDAERALVVLFAREHARFKAMLKAAGTPNDLLDRAHVALVDDLCPQGRKRCARRDVAWADLRTGRVTFVRRAAEELPYDNLVALVRHELGHLVDLTPDTPGSEQRADHYAEEASGQKIRYDEGDLQTIGAGVYPRPKHLHT